MTQRIGVRGTGSLNRRAPGAASPSSTGAAGPSSPLAPGKQTLTAQLGLAPPRHADAGPPGEPAIDPAPREAHPDAAPRAAHLDAAPLAVPRGPSAACLAQLHQSFGRPDR